MHFTLVPPETGLESLIPMKSNMPSALRSLNVLAALAAAMLSTAHATIVLYEGFDYGGTDGSLVGKGAAGSGWGGSWGTGTFTYTGSPTFGEGYQAAGLTFSSLAVTGGNAFLSSNGDGGINAGRVHTASITGSLYGSFLFRTASPTSTGLYSVFEGGSLGQASGSAQFAIEPDAYASSNGGVITGGDYTYASGTPISANETYLALYKVTNLGGASVSQTASMWLLKASQYNNFISGGIDESELDGAALGSGATEVLQRATRTVTGSASFSNGGLLSMQSYYFGAQAQFDELRISDTSLNEALGVVPEPGRAMLLLMGASTLMLRRRRNA